MGGQNANPPGLSQAGTYQPRRHHLPGAGLQSPGSNSSMFWGKWGGDTLRWRPRTDQPAGGSSLLITPHGLAPKSCARTHSVSESGQAFPTGLFYHSEGSLGTEKSETSKWKGAGISDMAAGAQGSVRDSLEMSSSRKPPALAGCRDQRPRGVTAHRGHKPGQERECGSGRSFGERPGAAPFSHPLPMPSGASPGAPAQPADREAAAQGLSLL